MALAAARDVGIDVGAGHRAANRRAGQGAGRAARRRPGEPAAKRAPSSKAAAPGAGARREPRRRRAQAEAAAARRRRAAPRRTRPAEEGTGAEDHASGPDRVFLPAREGRHPHPRQQRRDVRAAAAARRGAPVRGQLPPRPAAPADPAVGAGGHPGHRRRPASASCCATSAASNGSGRRPSGELAAVPGMTRTAAEAVVRPLGAPAGPAVARRRRHKCPG